MNTFEDWKEDYGLVHEPNYSIHTELDCRHAFRSGQESKKIEINELKKKINDALHLIKLTEGCCNIESIEAILNGNK